MGNFGKKKIKICSVKDCEEPYFRSLSFDGIKSLEIKNNEVKGYLCKSCYKIYKKELKKNNEKDFIKDIW